MKEIITLSMEEIHRLKILEQVEEGALSLISGTEVLKISYRHGKLVVSEVSPGRARRISTQATRAKGS